MKKKFLTLMAMALLAVPALMSCGVEAPGTSSTPSPEASTNEPSENQNSEEKSEVEENSSEDIITSEDATSSEGTSEDITSGDSENGSSEADSSEETSSEDSQVEETGIMYVSGDTRTPMTDGREITDGIEYSLTVDLVVDQEFNFALLSDATKTVDEWEAGSNDNKNAFTLNQLSAEVMKTEGEVKASAAKCVVEGSFTFYVKSYTDRIVVWAAPLPGSDTSPDPDPDTGTDPDTEPANGVTIYFEDAGWWNKDMAGTAAYAFKSEQKGEGFGKLMSYVSGGKINDVYINIWKVVVDLDAADSIVFTRVSQDGKNHWGAFTVDITLADRGENNMYSIKDTTEKWGDPGVTGVWTTYTEA